ncbi:MAG TPA: DUF58 domain-containing protein [Thermoanaerobaculia bacterium]|jgi:uncharacterized protein (DUF58 family)|nr:DUF58 domain-containing protein [Thermoanaerobaculia bacterium]
MSQPAFTFDGVVRFTRIGTAYLISTIVIGFAALNTGNNALYIGLTFMLGCLLLSGIASQRGLKHLHVELTGVDQAWAGRAADGLLRIENRSRIWNVRDVVIAADDLAQPLLVPIVPRRGTVEIGAAFLFQHRGIVELKALDFYTRYPFGFFLKKRRIRIHGEVVVFPRLLGEEAARARFRPVEGDQNTANRPGPGSEIHSFREYVRGDSLRHVYWKKSASLGRWIMKQTDAEAARAVHVVVDPFKPRYATENDFEEMVSEAATFIFHSVRRGLDVRLTLPRMTAQSSESASADTLFRALALLDPTYEPVHFTLDRDTIVFGVGRRDAATA